MAEEFVPVVDARGMQNKSLMLGWRARWNRSLRLFLRQRVRTSVDIDDLAQETYLRLLRARDLSDVLNPQAYLLKIASHVVAEWRDQQPPAGVDAAAAAELLVDDRTPELELDARIFQERLTATLEMLSPMMRAALLLKVRDGRSSREIAQELEITDRQVKRYLERGYDALRRAMDD